MQVEPQDKVQTLRDQVDGVKNIMTENVERILARGERLDDLMDKSEDLQAGVSRNRACTSVWCKQLPQTVESSFYSEETFSAGAAVSGPASFCQRFHTCRVSASMMQRVTWGLKYVDQVDQVEVAGAHLSECFSSVCVRQRRYDDSVLSCLAAPESCDQPCVCRRSTSSRRLRRWRAPTGGRTSS